MKRRFQIYAYDEFIISSGGKKHNAPEKKYTLIFAQKFVEMCLGLLYN